MLGLLHPFWPLFLVHSHFDATEIGQLLAIQMGTRIVSPNLWGWLADRSGRRVSTIRWGSALGCLSFAAIFLSEGFWSMALVMALYSFFWNAVMPQFEALTLDYLHGEPQRYSQLRLWGSVGFIASVLLGGFWFESRIQDFALAGWLFLLFIWLSSLTVPPLDHPPQRDSGRGFAVHVWRKPVATFLVVSFLLQVAHGIYYAFYSLQLEQQGYSRGTIGAFWAFSVVAEIGLFLLMRRWMTNWTLAGILIVSLALTAVRWLMISHLSFSAGALIIAQSLHAFSFGACHAVSVEYLRRFFPAHHRGQAQALYSSLSFGAGGAVGALMGGLLWQDLQRYTFDVAALLTFLAMVLAIVYLRDDRYETRVPVQTNAD